MFNRVTRKTGVSITLLFSLIVLASGSFIFSHVSAAASTVHINGTSKHQTMDGFGFSDAFGPAGTLQTAPAKQQTQILNLLFNTSNGAGFTILRNLLPSDTPNTIEPNSPGNPASTPQYQPLGSSEGQVWLAQQAQKYGVTQFYGDAWSAPGFMKNNGNEANGGQLCGVPAATCGSGDWRQAYANYLVQYIKDYQAAGIKLTNIGAFNEPNLTTSYSSMVMNPTQTANFISILGPTLKAAKLNTQIVCCDGEGWNTAQNYAHSITANNATTNTFITDFSSHGYTAPPNSALTGTTSKHIWQTEWATFDTWDPTWDSGTDASGFTWAQNIYNAITKANMSAFLYWWGIGFNSNDNGMLIHDNNGTITASKRLWALANYSRFIHPGATRVGTSSTNGSLETTAYTNPDGSVTIVVLNTATSNVTTSFAVNNTRVAQNAAVVPYLTNASNNTAAQATLHLANGSFQATVPARALVTYTIK